MFAPDYTPQRSDEPFAIMPLALIKDTKLTDGAKLLYAYIAAVNAPKSEPPRQAKIAADLEITPSAVTKRVKELVARDWLIVWTVYNKGLRYNAYQTFQTTNECRKYREEHLGISYVNFNDKLKERKARVGNRKSGDVSSSIIELVQASNQTNDGTGSIERNSSSSSISYVLADEYKADNTSISNEIDMRPAPQPQDMVSDTTQPDPIDDAVLVETHEDPFSKVPAKVSPVRKPQPHIAPLLAWFNAVGDDVQPPDFDIGRYTRLGKTQAKAIEDNRLTLEQMEQAGTFYRAWFDCLPNPSGTMLVWDVGGVTEVMRKALTAIREGYTPDDVEELARKLSTDNYWAGKNIRFDRFLELLVERINHSDQGYDTIPIAGRGDTYTRPIAVPQTGGA